MSQSIVVNLEPELRVELEELNTYSWNQSEADPEWHYIDKAQHGHFYAKVGNIQYPTLHAVMRLEYDDDIDEPYSVLDHYECPHCQEVIVPGTRYTDGRLRINGLKRYYVDGREIERDEFIVLWRESMVKRVDEQAADI